MRALLIGESAERAARLRDVLRSVGYDLIVIDTASAGPALLEQLAALFPEVQRLREQLAQANLRLSERKLVERAKGLLMKSRGLDEDAAYRALRRMAMDSNRRVGEVARTLIEASRLLA